MADVTINLSGNPLDGALISGVASDDNLQEIINVLNNILGKLGGSAVNIAVKGASAQPSAKPLKDINDFSNAISETTEGAHQAGSILENLSKLSGGLEGEFGSLLGGAEGLGAGLSELVPGIGEVVGVFELLKMAVTWAWDAFKFFEKLTHTIYDTNTAGAAFNNNIFEMNSSAARAGMSLQEYATIVKANSETFAQLGGTVTEGAEKFSQITKISFTKFGNSLGNMGINLDEYAKELPAILALETAGAAGRHNNDQQLAAGAHHLFVEMDGLAKLTGKTREEQQRLVNAQVAQAQYQAKLAQMDEQTRQRVLQEQTRITTLNGKAAGDAFMYSVLGIRPAFNTLAGALNAAAPGMQSEIDKMSIAAQNSSVSMKQFDQMSKDTSVRLAYLGSQAGKANESLSNAALASYDMSVAGQAVVNSSNDVFLANQRYAGMTQEQIRLSMESATKEQKSTTGTMSAFSNLNNAIKHLYRSFIDGIANPVMEVIAPVFNLLVNTVSALINGTAFLIDAIVATAKFLTTAFLLPFSLMSAQIKGFWTVVSTAFTGFWQGLSAPFNAIFKSFGDTWNSIKKSIAPMVNLFHSTTNTTQFFQQSLHVISKIFSFFGTIMTSLSPPLLIFKSVLTVILLGVKAFAAVIKTAMQELQPAFDTVSVAMAELKKSFNDAWITLQSALQPLMNMFGSTKTSGDGLAGVLKLLTPIIKFAATVLVDILIPVIKTVVAVIEGLVSVFKFIATIIKDFGIGVKAVTGFIKHPVSSTTSAIKHVFGFAEGTAATGSVVRDFGAGTPAVLHGKEAVLTDNQLKNAVVSKETSTASNSLPSVIKGLIDAVSMKAQNESTKQVVTHLAQIIEILNKSQRISENILKATA